MRRDSAIKKLLKIFLFIFSIYIFTIKIFLKNTLLCFDSQKKERRRQVSAFLAIFKADFDHFRHVSAVSGLYRLPADTARFWPNQPGLVRIEADSARIKPHRRESSRVGANPRKKKNADADRCAGNRVIRGCGTRGAASVLSRF